MMKGILSAVLVFVSAAFLNAQPFTYQGSLKDGGVPANGTYDMQFKLFDAVSSGNQIGSTITRNGVNVQNSFFTAELDFGTTAFTGANRWLEIIVNGTPLSPRVKINPAPYAIFSRNTRGITVDDNNNIGLGLRQRLGLNPSDAFSYDGKTMGHYTLGWFDDTWNLSGSTAWLSGYAGIKFFTNGALRLAVNQGGNVGIGVGNPLAKLHVFGHIRSDDGEFQSWGPIILHPDVDGTGDDSVGILNSNGFAWLKAQDSNFTIYSWGNGSMNIRFAYTNLPVHGVFEVGDGNGAPKAGVYVADNGVGVVWGGVKQFRVPNPRDLTTDIWYASLEGPEAAMYVRGKGRLVNGQATLELPDHFQIMMVPESLTVQLTPGSRQSKGLAYEIQNGRIVVFELNNGRGSYEFSWVVTSIRKGFEGYRVIRSWDEVISGEADRDQEWQARLKSIKDYENAKP
jgi:hypothetical protein